MNNETDRWKVFLAYLALALFLLSIVLYWILWGYSAGIAIAFLVLAQVAALALGILGWPLWPARVAVVGFVATIIVWAVQVMVKRGGP
jgi:hypothetical protein